MNLGIQTHDVRIRSTVGLLTQLRGLTRASLEYLDHPWLPQVLITQSTGQVTRPYCQSFVLCEPFCEVLFDPFVHLINHPKQSITLSGSQPVIQLAGPSVNRSLRKSIKLVGPFFHQ